MDGFSTLVGNLASHFTIWQYLEFFARLVVAGLCGALFGFERNKRSKDAGIRTHIIVCWASALAMIVSKYAFADLAGMGGDFLGAKAADPARIAAQVISGISFLCAGVIFKNGSTVRGLTTAAGIWATAGIGIAIGAGMYVIGVFSTLSILLVQLLLHRYKVGADAMGMARLRFNTDRDSRFKDEFMTRLQDIQAHVDEMNVSEETNGTITYELVIRYPLSVGLDSFLEYFDTKRDELHIYGVSGIG